MYLEDDTKKICIKCKQVKNIAFFHRNSCSKDGYSSYCKECTKKMAATRHVIHPYIILKQTVLNNTHRKCYLCGNDSNIKVHHILPRTMGGNDNQENLIPLCNICHLKAHNGPFSSGKLNQELFYEFKKYTSGLTTIIQTD